MGKSKRFCKVHPRMELMRVFPEEKHGTECMVCIHQQQEESSPPLWTDDSSYAAYQARD